ncbi:MAG: type II secretion system F family protein [Planctomycetota bacterium]|jgi:tight adherence protein C
MNLPINPLFLMFWGLLAFLVLLLIVRRIMNWRAQVRAEREYREAEYQAALGEASRLEEEQARQAATTAGPVAGDLQPADESPARPSAPELQTSGTQLPDAATPSAVPQSAIQADRYQAWSPPEVDTWEPPADQVYDVSWSGQELFRTHERSFEEPEHIPKVEPEDVPTSDTDDMAFGPATPAMASLMPMSDDERIRAELKQAGFHQPHAMMNLQATRFALMAGTVAMFGLLLLVVPKVLEIPVLLGMISVPLFFWAVPRMYIQGRGNERKSQIERAMPDMLDMLNMCVSQGLTIPKSLRRIAVDLKPVYPDLATELQMVVHQGEVGSMTVALNNFAERMDVPEVDSFVSLMTQAERMGTNVSDALTEYSNTMRESLRQRTDEKANNASFKLMFPTVLLMMPAVFLFLMGPAILELDQFFNAGGVENITQGTTEIQNFTRTVGQ